MTITQAAPAARNARDKPIRRKAIVKVEQDIVQHLMKGYFRQSSHLLSALFTFKLLFLVNEGCLHELMRFTDALNILGSKDV